MARKTSKGINVPSLRALEGPGTKSRGDVTIRNDVIFNPSAQHKQRLEEERLDREFKERQRHKKLNKRIYIPRK